MEITLRDVDRDSLSPLINSYEERIRHQKSVAQKAMQEVKKLVDTVSQLKYFRTQMDSSPQATDDVIEYPTRSTRIRKLDFDAGFSSSWSLSKKIEYILGKSDREHPLTSKEVTDRLVSLEPNLEKERDKTFKNVSTVLSIGNGKNFKRIHSNLESRGRREYLYYLN